MVIVVMVLIAICSGDAVYCDCDSGDCCDGFIIKSNLIELSYDDYDNLSIKAILIILNQFQQSVGLTLIEVHNYSRYSDK